MLTMAVHECHHLFVGNKVSVRFLANNEGEEYKFIHYLCSYTVFFE